MLRGTKWGRKDLTFIESSSIYLLYSVVTVMMILFPVLSIIERTDMSSAELDLVGIERTITGADAADEFKRIFGFSFENL